jgi:glycosyltransferase involved in cell wall biosynthesis
LRPVELLAELWWLGAEQELGMPIPHDPRRIVEPGAPCHIAVAACDDELALRVTLCSILERVEVPVELTVLIDDAASSEVIDVANRVAHALPGVRVIRGVHSPPGAEVLAAGDELPWSFNRASTPHGDSCTPHGDSWPPIPAVAYLLPGLPPEGSGGSHSLVQEARGLGRMGCEARICVPSEALDVATALYGNADELFVAYQEHEHVADAIGPATVVVATEHPSLAILEQLSRVRPELVWAYYVQDYEPLFAAPGSARADRALLSYRAIPGHVLFAKTHWLRNVVMARHGIPVAKVHPSLDRELFHIEGRVEADGVVRIAAMVRPRTPRRRPHATLRTLEAIRARLGERALTITFGCDAEAYAQVADDLGPGVLSDELSRGGEHLGLLTREQVAELMRSSDVFIDASAYQAFGRSGLEAMACGAVPVLPALGGVREYAEHERNAWIFDDDRPAALAEAVVALVSDPTRLRRLREDGLRTVADFSIERAAQSQLELFAAAARRRTGSATVAV